MCRTPLARLPTDRSATGRVPPRAYWMTLLWLAAWPCLAAVLPSSDAAGSRDHEHLRRFEGSVVLSYAQSAFEEFALPLAQLVHVPGESDAKNNAIRAIRFRVRDDHSGIELLSAPNRLTASQNTSGSSGRE